MNESAEFSAPRRPSPPCPSLAARRPWRADVLRLGAVVCAAALCCGQQPPARAQQPTSPTKISPVALTGSGWSNWRGPHHNGVADGKGYPTKWSDRQAVLWKQPLTGAGSTPIVWENAVFVTTATPARHNVLLRFNLDGEIQWTTRLGQSRPGKHRKASGANPSPVTDGRHVYAYYKSGELACVNFAGEVVWSTNLQTRFGEDTLWWDLGTSPVLTRDHVVVAVMQSGPSYLAAFDKQTGELAWKHDRNLDAPKESSQSYSTPLVWDTQERQQLIVLGADHVTAHAAETGKELWRVGGLNPTGHQFFRSIASPVVADGLVLAPYARGKSLTAIRLGGSGDVTKTHVAWTRQDVSTDVPTPVVSEGRAFVLRDKGEVVCLDVRTGETIWEQALPRNRNAFSSSPIIADGKLYLTREDGTTFVLAASQQFELLAENKLGEPTVASPVFVDGKILIRTANHLFCIGGGS